MTATPGSYASKWDFGYDGDGNRVSTLLTTYANGQVQSTELTVYYTSTGLSAGFGGAYETQSDGTIRKYYSFAGQTIAVFNLTPDTGTPDTLSYFLTDHLGSIVAVTDSSGTLTSQQRYLPFGEPRQLPNYQTTQLTDYGYTGQRSLGDELGLMDYRARFYHPVLARFVQPDTLIPDPSNPQAFNRYSYVANRPVNFNDPTGHINCMALSNPYPCFPIPSQSSDPCDLYSDSPQCSINGWRNDGKGNVEKPGAKTQNPPIGKAGGQAGTIDWYDGIYSTLTEIEDLFNWSLTTPGEMTLYKTPGYPFLGGFRYFYRPIYTMDNGQPGTIGPTSIGLGPWTLSFNGDFRYKQGLNSVSALGVHAPYFQPWAFKVSTDTSYSVGDSIITLRIGMEYTARPDNWAYVGAAAFIYATYGLGTEVLRQIPWGRLPITQ